MYRIDWQEWLWKDHLNKSAGRCISNRYRFYKDQWLHHADESDKIIEFAEIQGFVDTKIKFFSSGMMARLAFSITVNAGADIMFLDEIFSVGDMKFQEKAIKVFESSWIEGKTVVLVSHGMEIIRKYCNRAAFMKNGEIEFFGDTEKAIELYTTDNQ